MCKLAITNVRGILNHDYRYQQYVYARLRSSIPMYVPTRVTVASSTVMMDDALISEGESRSSPAAE